MIIDRRRLARGVARRHSRNSLLRRAGVALAVIASLPAPAFGQASQGFNFCVPPARPSCVFMPGLPAQECASIVEAYIASVFHYRECLTKESERAILESNDVIDHWRCRERGERCRR